MHLCRMLPALAFVCLNAAAQQSTPPLLTPLPGQILASGTVPDEASKAGILSRLRDVYGVDKVVDQIAVGSVVLPANWNSYVQKMISPTLLSISRGQLTVDGTTVNLRGEVANEAQRQQVASDIAVGLNPIYIVHNGLRVSASEQTLLDQALGNRIIEFNSSEAILTPAGRKILDDMASVLLKLRGRHFEVIGHTDNSGLRASNIALSHARANAIRDYLADKGVDTEKITTTGQGPDRPVASNDTADGRSRNRRIEFRIAR
jgi:OOP family OmpA-OmpF porin